LKFDFKSSFEVRNKEIFYQILNQENLETAQKLFLTAQEATQIALMEQ
jgi:hypothetical protein